MCWDRARKYLCCFAVVLILSFFALSTNADTKEIPTGLVRLSRDVGENMESISSGVLIGNKIYTCFHCVSPEFFTQIWATGIGEIDSQDIRIEPHPFADLAIIHLPQTYDTPFKIVETSEEFERLKALPWSQRFMGGYGMRTAEEGPKIYPLDGFYRRSNRISFQNPANVGPGYSGGPMYIEENAVYHVMGSLFRTFQLQLYDTPVVNTIRFHDYARYFRYFPSNLADDSEFQSADYAELTREYLQSHDYTSARFRDWAAEVTNAYQYFAIRSMIFHGRDPARSLDSLLRFDNPYQVGALTLGAIFDLSELYINNALLVDLKDHKTFSELQRRFFFEVRAEQKRGHGRWTKGFRKILGEVLEPRSSDCRQSLNSLSSPQ